MRGLPWLVIALVWVLPVRGQTAPPPVLPAFERFEPWPALRLAAEQRGLFYEGKATTGGRTKLLPGDAVAVLVTLVESGVPRQWLVEFKVSELDEVERERRVSAVRLFTSTGNEFDFTGAHAALAVRVIGPFDADNRDSERAARKAPEEQARVLVNSTFLALGFERNAATILRLRETAVVRPEQGQASFGLSTRPLPPEQIAAGRAVAEAQGLTRDDERALAGTLPALLEFFGVASRTPGLQDILFSIVDVPWWTIIRGGGRQPDIGIAFVSEAIHHSGPAAGINYADVSHYVYPFVLSLNGKPALVCQLAAAVPHAPESVVAGVVALAAGRPNGKKGRLVMRVIATRAGSSELAKTSGGPGSESATVGLSDG